jgi:hypothetical protein
MSNNYDKFTVRVEHEFSTRWIEQNPKLAAEQIGNCIKDIQASGMSISFDFYRNGFMTISATR